MRGFGSGPGPPVWQREAPPPSAQVFPVRVRFSPAVADCLLEDIAGELRVGGGASCSPRPGTLGSPTHDLGRNAGQRRGEPGDRRHRQLETQQHDRIDHQHGEDDHGQASRRQPHRLGKLPTGCLRQGLRQTHGLRHGCSRLSCRRRTQQPVCRKANRGRAADTVEGLPSAGVTIACGRDLHAAEILPPKGVTDIYRERCPGTPGKRSTGHPQRRNPLPTRRSRTGQTASASIVTDLDG